MSLLATRYAQALFECASEQGRLEDVARDIATLQSLMQESKEFGAFLNNPLIQKSAAMRVFKALSEKATFSDLTLNFIRLLGDQKRLKNLEKIAYWFHGLLSVASNTMEVHISSAKPLVESQRQSLKNLLKRKIDKEIVLHEMIDTEAMGGVIIQIGEYRIDSTIRTQLNKLHKVMRA